jgi:hypothetical protein
MTLVYVNNLDRVAKAASGDRSSPAAAWRMPLAHAGGQGGVVLPAPSERLGRRGVDVGERPAVWWVGVHGGAGESTLEQLFVGSRAAGHSWPLAAAGVAPACVVLVARTHAHGLSSAQSAIREWAAGHVEMLLIGLVLIADAPGRLPRPLARLASLVCGGVPAAWSLPWIEAWRLGEPPAAQRAARRPPAVGGFAGDDRGRRLGYLNVKYERIRDVAVGVAVGVGCC